MRLVNTPDADGDELLLIDHALRIFQIEPFLQIRRGRGPRSGTSHPPPGAWAQKENIRADIEIIHEFLNNEGGWKIVSGEIFRKLLSVDS